MEHGRERSHLTILKARVKSLEEELDVAIKTGKIIDERIKALQEGVNTIHSNRKQRLQELETKFEAEIAEQQRQIQLSQDVLAKKKEERQALMSYLNGLDLTGRAVDDFRDFQWESLRRIAENLHQPKEDLLVDADKANHLNELVQDAKHLLICLGETMSSTSLAKDRFVRTFDAFKEQSESWISMRSVQIGRIGKLQRDNECLNVLLKQSVSANENMTDYITKNVQAKCQSFLNSDSPYELLEGLKKFKARQDRVVRILRHKDDQLGSETNKLEVATDQTHDQVKFYLNLISSRRSTNLNRILGSEAPVELPVSGS